MNSSDDSIEKSTIEELPFENTNFDISLFFAKLEVNIEDGLDYYNKYYYKSYVTNDLWKYYIDTNNNPNIIKVKGKKFELNGYYINIDGKENKIGNLLKRFYVYVKYNTFGYEKDCLFTKSLQTPEKDGIIDK